MPLDLISIFYLKVRDWGLPARFGTSNSTRKTSGISRRDAACRVFRAVASGFGDRASPSLPQLLKEQTNRFNPAMKIRNVELLVRSMQVVVGKPKAHHDRWNLQHVLKIGHDRNRPAGANKHGFFLERVMERLTRRLDEWVVGSNPACESRATS